MFHVHCLWLGLSAEQDESPLSKLQAHALSRNSAASKPQQESSEMDHFAVGDEYRLVPTGSTLRPTGLLLTLLRVCVTVVDLYFEC